MIAPAGHPPETARSGWNIKLESAPRGRRRLQTFFQRVCLGGLGSTVEAGRGVGRSGRVRKTRRIKTERFGKPRFFGPYPPKSENPFVFCLFMFVLVFCSGQPCQSNKKVFTGQCCFQFWAWHAQIKVPVRIILRKSDWRAPRWSWVRYERHNDWSC